MATIPAERLAELLARYERDAAFREVVDDLVHRRGVDASNADVILAHAPELRDVVDLVMAIAEMMGAVDL